MTPEEQRRAIAEACGWVLPLNEDCFTLQPEREPTAYCDSCSQTMLGDAVKRAEKAEAACAEMGEALERCDATNYSGWWYQLKQKALRADCGKGWLSPEKAKRLRDELEKCRDFFEGRNIAIHDSIKRALAETEDK